MLHLWTFVQARLATRKTWKECETGAEMTEYALILGLIALVLFAAIIAFQEELSNLWGKITTGLAGAPVTT
jgi:Flp pilus assembly pilin Flp